MMYEGFFDLRSTRDSFDPLHCYILIVSHCRTWVGSKERPKTLAPAEEYMAMPVSRTC